MIDDGRGDFGADDNDISGMDSETEMEGRPDDNSDSEAETERPTTQAMPQPTLKNREEGKGRDSAGVSSLATSAVREGECGSGLQILWRMCA